MVIDMSHGGKRANAGRKATGVTETKVIRVDATLAPLVNEIKTLFKESGIIPDVTTNQDGLKEGYDAGVEYITELITPEAKPLQQQPVFELTQDREQELNTKIELLQREKEGLTSRVDYLELRLKEAQHLLIPNKVYTYTNSQWIAEIAYDSKSGFYYRREKPAGILPACYRNKSIRVKSNGKEIHAP